jgi:hypothetical protein
MVLYDQNTGMYLAKIPIPPLIPSKNLSLKVPATNDVAVESGKLKLRWRKLRSDVESGVAGSDAVSSKGGLEQLPAAADISI